MVSIKVTTNREGVPVEVIYDGESVPLTESSDSNSEALFEDVNDGNTYTVALGSAAEHGDKVVAMVHIVD